MGGRRRRVRRDRAEAVAKAVKPSYVVNEKLHDRGYGGEALPLFERLVWRSWRISRKFLGERI